MDIRVKILEAAVQVFMRFGVGRTRMGDIAEQAGLVRQTLYTVYKNKDEILRATILHVAARSLDELQNDWSEQDHLTDHLESYYQRAIYPSFSVISASPEARDMVGGYNEVGRQAVAEAQNNKIQSWVDVLTAKSVSEPDILARYIVLGALGLRDLAGTKEDLEVLLAVHKRAVVEIAAH